MPKITYTHAQAIDLLRTMFSELWDDGGDMLECIHNILSKTEGAATFRPNGLTEVNGGHVTWRSAFDCWHTARGDSSIPNRERVIQLIKADGDDVDSDEDTVTCKLCEADVPSNTAHSHKSGWICDACWDQRLSSTA